VQQTVLPEWSSNSPTDLEHVSSSPTDSEEDENESDSSSENEIPMLTEPRRCYHAVYQKSPGLGTTPSLQARLLMF
jgi:hypothetical protein